MQRPALPTGSALEPIGTPLVFSGFQAAALQPFASQLQSYGFVAAQGGTAAPRADDSQLKPGDMAGMVLVQGDASINSACTVTAVQADRVFLCGHPFLSLGDVQLPMARSRVLTTLSSSLASTKIVNVGGSIGTITGDHVTAVTGKLGAPPGDDSAGADAGFRRRRENNCTLSWSITRGSLPFSWLSPLSAALRRILYMAKAPRCISPAKSVCKTILPWKLKILLRQATRLLPTVCRSR